MTKKEIFGMISGSPVFHIATVDEKNFPHVRACLLYKADENGIIFHTGDFKDLNRQLSANQNAEICFQCSGTQVRISGKFELVEDDALTEEIYNHPSRQFLRNWSSLEETKKFIRVYRMKGGTATTWTMADNFKGKKFIQL